MLLAFKCVSIFINATQIKFSMCIDSLIAINSLSLAAFPLFIALPYTGKRPSSNYQIIYCFIENQI